MKKFLMSLIVVIISLLAILIILEIGIRIFYPQADSSQWFESSPEYGYFTKRNFSQDLSFPRDDFVMHVQTNSFGHRYKEYNSAEFTDKRYKKVLLLGDSFMFGYGVNMEDHIATHIDHQLNDTNNLFTIINAGVDGWSTIQEVTYARDHFRLLNPDIIVLFFCGDDPDDDDRYLVEKPDHEKGTIHFPGKIFLRDHSQLYRLLYYGYAVHQHKRTIKKKIKADENLVVNEQSGSVITPEQWHRTLKTINDFYAGFMEFNEQGVVIILSTSPWDSEHRQNLASLSNGTNMFYLDLYDETIDLQEQETRTEIEGPASKIFHQVSAQKISDKIMELNL